MTKQEGNPAGDKQVHLEPGWQVRPGPARWFRHSFRPRYHRTSSGGPVSATRATTTAVGSRPKWQRTDLIGPGREVEVRAVLAKWGAQGWDNFPLERPDVEWLLINQDELPIAYRVKSFPGLASLHGANLANSDLSGLPLEECDLSFARLDSADLTNAKLAKANLEFALLRRARLEGADLREARLARANLREAWLDNATVLTDAYLFTEKKPSPARGYVRGIHLAGVRWNETDISSVADLDRFRCLGDDLPPWPLRLKAKLRGKNSGPAERARLWRMGTGRDDYQKYLSDAIAAYRQFARVLRNSGLPHIAVRAEYRARQLERQVRRSLAIRPSERATRRGTRQAEKADELSEKLRQGRPVSHKLVKRLWYIFVFSLDRPRDALRRSLSSAWCYCTRAGSFLLDLICGYGYKPLRVLTAYVATILVFARIYATYPPQSHTPRGWNTIWFSMIAFHGRGVISGDIDPDAGMLWVPALEAVIGLSIEAMLVAVIIRHLFRSSD